VTDEAPAGCGLARPASAVRRSEARKVEGTDAFAWQEEAGAGAEAGERGRSNRAKRRATPCSQTQRAGMKPLSRGRRPTSLLMSADAGEKAEVRSDRRLRSLRRQGWRPAPAATRGGARHNADYTKTARTMRAGRAS
jgi:hypothetical protein